MTSVPGSMVPQSRAVAQVRVREAAQGMLAAFSLRVERPLELLARTLCLLQQSPAIPCICVDLLDLVCLDGPLAAKLGRLSLRMRNHGFEFGQQVVELLGKSSVSSSSAVLDLCHSQARMTFG